MIQEDISIYTSATQVYRIDSCRDIDGLISKIPVERATLLISASDYAKKKKEKIKG